MTGVALVNEKRGNKSLFMKNKITASCVISNHKVYKDGKLILKGGPGNLADFLASVYDFIEPNYPKFYKMDLLSKLGWLASEILLRDSFDTTRYLPEEVGVVLSNSNASLDTDRRYYKTVSDYPSPSLFVYTLPNIVIGEICIRNRFCGENAFFIFENFQADFIEQYAGSLLTNNVLKCCVCGWVEVLNDEYKAALYLVETTGDGLDFNVANLQELFQPEH